MTSEEIREAISKLAPAQVLKLKEVGTGLQVGRVLGDRVLIRVIEPYTDADRVEKEGLLIIPETVKEKVTPLPSTGVVIGVGDGVPCTNCNKPKRECTCGDYSPVLQEGEVVMFSRYAGFDFTISQESGFRILDRAEVLCTLVDTKGGTIQCKPE